MIKVIMIILIFNTSLKKQFLILQSLNIFHNFKKD